MVFGFDDARESHRQVHHEGKLSHELIAGAASFGAMKIFEDKQRKEGKPVKHQLAKEVLAGIVGAEVDKLIETKGADAVDRYQTKKHAEERTHELYEQHYGADPEYDPRRREAHESIRHHEHREESEHRHREGSEHRHHHHHRDNDDGLSF